MKRSDAYYWGILIAAMGGRGYVLAADLAKKLGSKRDADAAWPAWQEFCRKGKLLKYQKAPQARNSPVAYVLPEYEKDFELNYPGFAKIIC